MAQNIRAVARRTGKALFGVSGVSGFTDDLKAQWDSSVADFQARRAELDQAESSLYEVWPRLSDPDDIAEWQRCFNKVNAAKSGMDAVASLVQGAADMWGSVTGLFGLGGVGSTLRRRGVVNAMAGNLGIAPFALPISLATLAGLTAAAVAAISLTYAFIAYINAKTSRYQMLVDSGVDPIEASKEAERVAQQESGYSTGARVEKIVLYAAIAAGILAFSPAFRRK